MTTVLKLLKRAYGGTAPLTMTRGKVRKYLVMTFDFYNFIKVNITIFDYIDSILNKSPSDMDVEADSPTSNHPFEVQDNAEDINPE